MSPNFRARPYDDKDASIKPLADIALLRTLWKIAEPVRSLLGLAFIFMLADISSDLVRPYLMKIAIDDYIAVKNMSGLQNLFYVYIATIFAGLFLSFGENLLLQKAGQKVIQAVRERVFSHILRQQVPG